MDSISGVLHDAVSLKNARRKQQYLTGAMSSIVDDLAVQRRICHNQG